MNNFQRNFHNFETTSISIIITIYTYISLHFTANLQHNWFHDLIEDQRVYKVQNTNRKWEVMEDFLNLHGINRSDLKEKDRRVTGNKRNSKFVRSDALSPNSVNRLIIETELEKITRRNTGKTGGELRVNLGGNNNENKIELGGTGTGTSVKNCFVRLKYKLIQQIAAF